jgi:hypothetical protein
MSGANKLTRKQAINANCRSCVYDPANGGNWRQQVTLCACRDCALWLWRPVSRSDLPEVLLDAYGLTDAQKQHLRGPERDFYA